MSVPLKKMSFSKVRSSFFFGLIFALLLAFVFLLRPFSYPLFWAAILAVLFHPFYELLNTKLKSPSISSAISVVLVLCVIIVPIAIVGLLLVHQSVEIYSLAVEGNFVSPGQLTEFISNSPLAPYVDVVSINQLWATYVNDATKTISAFFFQNTKAVAGVFANVKSVTQSSLWFLFQVFIMLYSLYYFFKDGKKLLGRVKFLSPLGNGYEEMFYEKFRGTSVSTLKTTFIIGGIQGLIGGLLFFITGIQGAFVWGVIMMVMSILPAIGSFIIWVPAGIVMLLLGNVWQGVTILLVGGLVISTIDNVLRPPLVGKDTQMHPLIVLLSSLGGILAFGISGFVIGPILASFFLAAISMYEYYYHRELEETT
jgi:predicted PurR-regulated permease PerM